MPLIEITIVTVMASLLDTLQEHYGTRDLYQALSVSKTASGSELKRAYYAMSLKVHPDRVIEDEKEICTKKFQTLTKVYSILSDSEKRACYDETGEVDEEADSLSQERDWTAYWRILYQKISVSDIKEFEAKYRGSDEEKQEVKMTYMDCKGDMDRILETVLCCQVDDEERFRVIIDESIASGELTEFKAYKTDSKKKKLARKTKVVNNAAFANSFEKERLMVPL